VDGDFVYQVEAVSRSSGTGCGLNKKENLAEQYKNF
jgi:hypothetical protein